MAIDTQHFKERLESEAKRIEKELASVGKKNPGVKGDWVPTPDEMNVMKADKNELADTMEEFETRAAIEVELENRLLSTHEALKEIEAGTYGICKICGKEIEPERLEANPSAKTCKAHLDE